jgi:hypothetical protein
VRYSLVYVSDVNARPREVVGATSLVGCTADSSKLLNDQTCGSLYYSGQRVAHSEGYCCSCSLDQMLGMGGHHRGEVQCNLFTSLFKDGSSVHCLRWGPIWYSLFKLMTPAIQSEVHVFTPDEALNITLSDSIPVVSSSVASNQLNVTARIVGSFSWSRAPTDWGLNVYAATPNVPASHTSPDKRITESSLSDPFKYGLLIPQSSVDLSGKTCNKIGVSHHAFVNNQGSRCSGRIGDCLQNQVEDIWESAKSQDWIDSTLCESIGGVFVRNDGYRLSCRLDQTSADSPTQVLLELNAAKVSFVYIASTGTIVNVTTRTDSIEALVQNITVNVLFNNTGDISAEFSAAVTHCNPNSLIAPLGAVKAHVPPYSLHSLSIKMEDSNMTASSYDCRASLSDPDGYLLSEKEFSFNITESVINRAAQDDGFNETNISFTPRPVVDHADPCDSQCTGFFSIICFVGNACWSKLGALLGTVGGTSLLLFLLTKFGVWGFVGDAILTCCRGKSKPRKRRNSDDSSIHPSKIQHQVYYLPHPQYMPSAPPMKSSAVFGDPF